MTVDKRKALGRGLSALIPGATSLSAVPVTSRRDYFECAIEDVNPASDNPRKAFDGEKLRELAESIRTQGVVQPLVVSPDADGTYFIIAGERRWRASRRAGLEQVPVVVRQVADALLGRIALQ